MIRVALVDDEAAAAEQLRECLLQYGRETGTEFETVHFSTGDAFLSKYRKGSFQMIFMDIDMPGRDGLSVGRRLREVDKETILIFVTNLAQYAINGYEMNALDFVLKPVNYYSFRLKIKKALDVLKWRADAWLLIPSGGNTLRVKESDIQYIEIQKHDLIFHTNRGQIHSQGTLKAVEEQLDGGPFFRCNYCYLINLAHVTQTSGEMVTVGGDELPISRSRKKEFLRQLARFYGEGGQ